MEIQVLLMHVEVSADTSDKHENDETLKSLKVPVLLFQLLFQACYLVLLLLDVCDDTLLVKIGLRDLIDGFKWRS